MCEQTELAQVERTDGDDVIAVDDAAAVIDGDQAVRVAVERDAHVGAVLDHGGRDEFRVRGATARR